MLIEEILIKTQILVEEAKKYSLDIYEQMDYIHKHSQYDSDIKLNAIKQLIDEQRDSITEIEGEAI